MKSVKNLIVKSEVKKAVAPATSRSNNASGGIDMPQSIAYCEKLRSLSALAAAITGSAAKNENSAAARLSMPSIHAPSTVAPERDVPGTSASA